MEQYIAAELEIISFDSDDVITASKSGINYPDVDV